MRISLFVLSVLAYTSVNALNLEAEEQDYDQALQSDFLAQTYAEDIPAIGDCMVKKLSGKGAPEAKKCDCAKAPAPAPKKPADAKADGAKAKVEEKKEEAKKKADDATAKANTDVKAALDKAQA